MNHRESPPVRVLGGNVYTVDPAVPHAGEVAVRDDRIARVDDAADVPARVVNAMSAAFDREARMSIEDFATDRGPQ
ncbi:hypothetical protein SsS58_03061 [Streptomyces scabiei]|uniref:Uncharacterized protein n=1 Tax=Streptomyces scabiei TaxID=1930 RepID=A0A117EDR0_STRSC|nr:hypothetical protein SsS58_03061 [Streptomyces scabiei]